MTWADLINEAHALGTFALLAVVIIALPLLRVVAPSARRQRLMVATATGLHVALMVTSAGLAHSASEAHRDVSLVALVLVVGVFTLVASTLLFEALLPKLNVSTPRIVQDVVIGTVTLFATFSVAATRGIDLTGLFATSAVITVVIGFALQDTLGNVLAGLTLQADKSIAIGNWITVGDKSGRVTQMRWRYTAIETRNWETLVIPNSVLTKEQVVVLGRREGQAVQWRRWVHFNIDFRFTPTDVIFAVNEALASAPIDNVAESPVAHCILMGFEQSFCHYAARYWLTDISVDDPTDSVVRTRIYFSLKRANIPLSIPAAALFLTKESAARRQTKQQADIERRAAELAGVRLFARLSDEERTELARGLRYAPFSRGEAMTREGATAHWLYLIIEGEASIRVTTASGRQAEVGRVGANDFFGEMSLMTGEPRAATVVAVTDVECYRLDKEAFVVILERRPEMVDHFASVLAERRFALDRTREASVTSGGRETIDAARFDLGQKIRRFFGV